MPAITVGQENSSDIELHYEDHDAGQVPPSSLKPHEDLLARFPCLGPPTASR
jgi:hypothetical protein